MNVTYVHFKSNIKIYHVYIYIYIKFYQVSITMCFDLLCVYGGVCLMYYIFVQ